jgi:hypothetical protein
MFYENVYLHSSDRPALRAEVKLCELAFVWFIFYFFFHWLNSPLDPWPLFFFQFRDRFTDGRTPWMSDQLVARPLPKHRTTNTE